MRVDNKSRATIEQRIEDSDGVVLDLPLLSATDLMDLPELVTRSMPRLERLRLRCDLSVTNDDFDYFRHLSERATLADGQCLLSHIESLDCAISRVKDWALIRLLSAPRRGIPLRLRSLILSSGVTDEAAVAIAQEAAFGALEAVELLEIMSEGVTDYGISELFSATARLPALRSLLIGGHAVTDDSMLSLRRAVENDALSHLEWLTLKRTTLTDRGVITLVSALNTAQTPELRSLDLMDALASGAAGSAVAQAAASGELRQLRSLSLRGTSVTNECIIGLGSATEVSGLSHLQVLDLQGASVLDEAFLALARGAELGGLPELQELDLSRSSVRDNAFVALARAAEAGAMPQLKSLILWGTSVSDIGVIALARAIHAGALRQLQSLNLWQTSVSDAGVLALAGAAEVGALPQLHSLNLMYTSASDAGILGLARAADANGLSQLHTLCVDGTNMSDNGILALAASAEAGSLLQLQTLSAFNTKVTDVGIKGLVRAVDAGGFKKLRCLGVHPIDAAIPQEISSSTDAQIIMNWYREYDLSAECKRVSLLFEKIELAYWLKDLVAFWCIGYVEREALMSCGDALGWESLRVKLKELKTAYDVSGLAVSQGHIRGVVERLESMFNGPPFVGDAWAEDERSPDFRVERMRGRRKESRWTPRARKAWHLVDRFFAIKGLTPIPEQAEQ